ncbi:MAG: hypothetical protein KF858_08890 [Candidatus Sumerlaeia bacterium]|nr:hypothetical protein [Candidatus Sumerlaeia bacterium]
MRTYLLAVAMLAAGTTVASAATLTVAKSGTPNHSTIQAAITAAADGDVIQILDDAVYDEGISVTKALTIEGTGTNRPILALQAGPTQATGDTLSDGLVVQLPAAGSVTLRNLILIPSATNTPLDDLLRTAGTDLTITLDNLLITSNNGANAPVTTDGLSAANMTGAIQTGDDGIFLAGTNTIGTLTNVVVSHHQNTGTGRDGIVCSAVINSVTIGDGCVFSYNGRLGIQAHGAQSFVINAPNDRVIVKGNAGFAGVWFAGAQAATRSINGLISVNNTGFGLEHQSRGAIEATLSNMILANNGGLNMVVGEVGTGNTVITDSTISNGATNAMRINAAAAGDVTVTNSIFGGSGTGTGIIEHLGTGTLTLNNCAVVTAGLNRLADPPTGGTGTIVQNSVINADPGFLQISNETLESFFQVTSAAYETAGTAGSNLKGGGTFGIPEVPASADSNWLLYN